MHKIKRVSRLSHEPGSSQRETARACRLRQPSVHRVLKRAREAGLAWPLTGALDEAALAARLHGEWSCFIFAVRLAALRLPNG